MNKLKLCLFISIFLLSYNAFTQNCRDLARWRESVESQFDEAPEDIPKRNFVLIGNHLFSDKFFIPVFGKSYHNFDSRKQERFKKKVIKCLEASPTSGNLRLLEYINSRQYQPLRKWYRYVHKRSSITLALKQKLIPESNKTDFRIQLENLEKEASKVEYTQPYLLPKENESILDSFWNKAAKFCEKGVTIDLNDFKQKLRDSINYQTLLRLYGEFYPKYYWCKRYCTRTFKMSLAIQIKNIYDSLTLKLTQEYNEKLNEIPLEGSQILNLNQFAYLVHNSFDTLNYTPPVKPQPVDVYLDHKYIRQLFHNVESKKTSMIEKSFLEVMNDITKVNSLDELSIKKRIYLSYISSDEECFRRLQTVINGKRNNILQKAEFARTEQVKLYREKILKTIRENPSMLYDLSYYLSGLSYNEVKSLFKKGIIRGYESTLKDREKLFNTLKERNEVYLVNLLTGGFDKIKVSQINENTIELDANYRNLNSYFDRSNGQLKHSYYRGYIHYISSNTQPYTCFNVPSQSDVINSRSTLNKVLKHNESDQIFGWITKSNDRYCFHTTINKSNYKCTYSFSNCVERDNYLYIIVYSYNDVQLINKHLNRNTIGF